MLDGLLLVNKPAGITSHDVVAVVRRILRRKDIGHAGTLDPLASGLMVLLIGEATKISDFVLKGEKGYEVKARLGLRTDTLDVTGQVLAEQIVDLEVDTIRKEVESMQGVFRWPIPIFSAAKVQGEKLYEKARRGESFIAPSKEMTFSNVELLSVGSNEFVARLRCSKGSFIRSWVDEVGNKLGVGACMLGLERIWSAPYSLDQALGLAEIETMGPEELEGLTALGAHIPLADTLQDWPTVTVKGRDEKLLNNGQISHDLERRLIPITKSSIPNGTEKGVRILSADTGSLLSILQAQPGRGLKIRRVFR